MNRSAQRLQVKDRIDIVLNVYDKKALGEKGSRLFFIGYFWQNISPDFSQGRASRETPPARD
jgi:hypothetical protein